MGLVVVFISLYLLLCLMIMPRVWWHQELEQELTALQQQLAAQQPARASLYMADASGAQNAALSRLQEVCSWHETDLQHTPYLFNSLTVDHQAIKPEYPHTPPYCTNSNWMRSGCCIRKHWIVSRWQPCSRSRTRSSRTGSDHCRPL